MATNSQTIIWTKAQAQLVAEAIDDYQQHRPTSQHVYSDKVEELFANLELLLADPAPLGNMNSLIIIIDHDA